MDLFALNLETDEPSFSANWTSWGMLRDLLIELGADVEDMAGSNDGDVVDADTAARWADAIRGSWDKIWVVSYLDNSFAGGLRRELAVEGTQTPALISTSSIARALSGVVDEPVSGKAVSTRLSDTPDLARFVKRFATFCSSSGGFEQW